MFAEQAGDVPITIIREGGSVTGAELAAPQVFSTGADFDVADEDGSGTLTRAEYEGARLQDFGVTFEESDTNADGETSLAEYLALYEQHHGSGDGVGL